MHPRPLKGSAYAQSLIVRRETANVRQRSCELLLPATEDALQSKAPSNRITEGFNNVVRSE